MSEPSGSGDRGETHSVADLLAHSLAIEAEAADRYAELADQMEVHNNVEVADLFRRMCEIEGRHVARVRDLSAGTDLPHIAPWNLSWNGAEAPECPSLEDVHYLMTPYHALSLALQGERRAVDFFSRIARGTEDPDVRRLASELAEEERDHVRLMEQWLARYPQPEPGWDEDHDPPIPQE